MERRIGTGTHPKHLSFLEGRSDVLFPWLRKVTVNPNGWDEEV